MDQLIAKYSEAQTGTHHPRMAASGRSTCRVRCVTHVCVRVRVCVCVCVCVSCVRVRRVWSAMCRLSGDVHLHV
jgi:hypothetical protein